MFKTNIMVEGERQIIYVLYYDNSFIIQNSTIWKEHFETEIVRINDTPLIIEDNNGNIFVEAEDNQDAINIIQEIEIEQDVNITQRELQDQQENLLIQLDNQVRQDQEELLMIRRNRRERQRIAREQQQQLIPGPIQEGAGVGLEEDVISDNMIDIEEGDFEDIIEREDEILLARLIQTHQNKTTNQIAIVTLDSIGSYTDFDLYTIDLANHWGVGEKDKNNGVLIAVSKKYRKVRIQVGDGLLNSLTKTFN